MKNYIIVDVMNGQGYSEPTIKTSKTHAEAKEVMVAMFESYGHTFNFITSYNENHITFEYGDKDRVTIRIIETSKNYRYYLVFINPDTLTVRLLMGNDDKSDLKSFMESLAVDNNMNFDVDDVTEFEEYDMDVFGSHCEHGEFIHYEIAEVKQ